ncbi:MAG: NTP transferase domain-containing protein [Candidatus Cybelea sp.]
MSAVIMAAGTSSRVGKQKLLIDFRGRPMIEHAIAAARAWAPVVVAGSEVAAYLAGRTGLTVLRNDEPRLGMSHSLKLANHFVAGGSAIVVLLGDKPLVTAALIERVCNAAGDADMVYPARGAQPGHPVFLSPRARERIDDLPNGDSLRTLRDDVRLRVHAVEIEDEGAFFDVDTIAALRA